MNKSSPIIIVVFCFWLASIPFTLFFKPPREDQKTNIYFYLELSYKAPLFTIFRGPQSIRQYLSYLESKKKAREFADDFSKLIHQLDIKFPPEQKTFKSPAAYIAQDEILDRLPAFDFFLKYNDVERAEKSILKREKQNKNDMAYQTSQLALKYAEHGHCHRAQQLLSPLLENKILFIRTFREHYAHLFGYNIDIILNIFFAKLLCEDSQKALDFLIFYDYSFISNIHTYTDLLQKLAIILNNQNKKELSLKVLEHANDIDDVRRERKFAYPTTSPAYKAIGQEDELAKAYKKLSQYPNYKFSYTAQYYLQDNYNSFENKIAYIYNDSSLGSFQNHLKKEKHFLQNNVNHPHFKNAIEQLINTPFLGRTTGIQIKYLFELYVESHSDEEIWALLENKGVPHYGINPDAVIPVLIYKEKYALLDKYITKNYEKIFSHYNPTNPNWRHAIAALDSLNYTGNINKIKKYKLTHEIALAIHKNVETHLVIRYILNHGHTDLAIELQKQQDFKMPNFWIIIMQQNMAKLEPQVNFEAELTEEAFLRQFSDYE